MFKELMEELPMVWEAVIFTLLFEPPEKLFTA